MAGVVMKVPEEGGSHDEQDLSTDGLMEIWNPSLMDGGG